MTIQRIKWNLLHGIYGNRAEVLVRLQLLTGAEVFAFLADADVWQELANLPPTPDAEVLATLADAEVLAIVTEL